MPTPLCIPAAFANVSALVAIPVRDEVERIADCLLALDGQNGPAPGVLLLVNNTTDATVTRVADLVPALRCPVQVIEHVFPLAQANAGNARRMAMAEADACAPRGVPLLTTDADGRVGPGWLAANLRHLNRGLDAVFGRAVIDPVEAEQIPPALHEADARECVYAALLDEIAALIDPDPDDPWPRHTEHSGASIAVSRAAFHAVGGIPAVPLGEDRAFHHALRRADARIVHAREVQVVVSGRILGRADGGMADTIRRRLAAPDTMLDDALEPVAAWVRRVRMRRAARAAFRAEVGERKGGFDRVTGERLAGPIFGEAWASLDVALPRTRVPVTGLAAEMEAGLAIRDRLVAVRDRLQTA